MAQDVMIRDSNISFYNKNARGPMATSLETRNNLTRFNEATQDVYGSPSIYPDQSGLNFGFRQPFVWVSPGDSEFNKYIKRFDSRAFPIGSVAQDVERIGKLMVSGKGIFFTATQLLLQSQQAFNETNLYNPLSVIQMVAQPATFGLIPRVKRHFDQSNFLASFGFTGGGDVPAPSGTAGKQALPNETKADGATGLLRAKTANRALKSFGNKWGTNSTSKQGFLDQLLSNFAPALLPITKPAETYRADDQSFKTMVDDTTKSTNTSRLNSSFVPRIGSTKPFSLISSPTETYETIKKNPSTTVGYGTTDKTGNENLSSLDKKLNTLLNPLTNQNSYIYNNKTVPPSKYKNQSGKIQTLSTYSTIPKSSPGTNQNPGRNPETGYSNSVTTTTLDQLGIVSPSGDTQGSVRKSLDRVNNGGEDGKGRILSTLSSDPSNPNNSSNTTSTDATDLISFIFYDIVNGNMIQFRSTLTGIGNSNSAEWESFRYLGRADQVFIYKGFTRTLNFNFTAYANNQDELDSIWSKVNYLTGLTQPSKYTNGFIIVPPFIKITIGNFFTNQPIILNSVDISLKDEGGWVLDEGRQLPMFVDISCNCNLLETVRPETNNKHFGFDVLQTENQKFNSVVQSSPQFAGDSFNVAQSNGAPADAGVQLPLYDQNQSAAIDAINQNNNQYLA